MDFSYYVKSIYDVANFAKTYGPTIATHAKHTFSYYSTKLQSNKAEEAKAEEIKTEVKEQTEVEKQTEVKEQTEVEKQTEVKEKVEVEKQTEVKEQTEVKTKTEEISDKNEMGELNNIKEAEQGDKLQAEDNTLSDMNNIKTTEDPMQLEGQLEWDFGNTAEKAETISKVQDSSIMM